MLVLLIFLFASGNEIKLIASILIFSGRPNPSWDITKSEDIDTIREKLKDLPLAAKPQWPILGFTGFKIENKRVVNFPREVNVFKGVVMIRNGDAYSYFEDANDIEGWLRAQAITHGLEKYIPTD